MTTLPQDLGFFQQLVPFTDAQGRLTTPGIRWEQAVVQALKDLVEGGGTVLADASETSAGTSSTTAVTPDGLAGSIFGTKHVQVAVSGPADPAITTGDGKGYFSVPVEMNGMNLVSVGASVSTVSSVGIPTVQIRRLRAATPADMLSTKLTIDASETDSKDAATPAVIDAANDDVATGDQIWIDIDVAGTGAKGLNIRLGFRLP